MHPHMPLRESTQPRDSSRPPPLDDACVSPNVVVRPGVVWRPRPEPGTREGAHLQGADAALVVLRALADEGHADARHGCGGGSTATSV